MATVEADEQAQFTVGNIGGIDDATVEIPPGVSALTGTNATNRTSFLQAIKAGLGSTNASLKGDAAEGHVRLHLDGDEYHRTLTRENGRVTFGGEPYLDDPTLAELFAFLLEDNEARRTVARSGDLRELIMRPVNVDEIITEIQQLEAEKGEINQELAELESLKRELPALEQRRTALRGDIEDKRKALETKEAEIESASASGEETREEKEGLESKLDELRDTRSDLEQVRHGIETAEQSITSFKRERSELRDELSELPESPTGDRADLNDRISRLREQKQQRDQEIQNLQSTIQFNEAMLDEGAQGVLDDATADDEAADITAQLVADDGTVCWTCGSEVQAADVEATLESLRSVRRDKLDESADFDDEMAELKRRQQEVKQVQGVRDSLETKLTVIESDLEDRQERLDELRERKGTLTDAVENLEQTVDDLESGDFDEVLDLHREANQLEFELDRLESDLEDVTDEIEGVEERIQRKDDLVTEREMVLDDLEDCRTRIDQIEADAIDEFHAHMDTVLELLGYDNLDRIWIERKDETVRDGRQKIERSIFDLHVVRSTESGAAYEDTVDHLSESEREVTGLVFALAGYLVHDVHEQVPFMLLDSLEAIDAERIATLVDYFADYAEYLVVALLPEDAQALDESHPRISPT